MVDIQRLKDRFYWYMLPKKAEERYLKNIEYTHIILDNTIASLEAKIKVINHVRTVAKVEAMIENIVNDMSKSHVFDKKQLYLPFHACLYLLTRLYNYSEVVETGVGPGSSGYMLLRALEKNQNCGTLTSIDIQDRVILGKTSVPIGLVFARNEALVTNWKYFHSDSRNVLQHVLLHLKTDNTMFVSGSDHSYEVQHFELETAKEFFPSKIKTIVVDRPDYNAFTAINTVFPLATRNHLKDYSRTLFYEKSETLPYRFEVIQSTQ
jgi:hypothetical protein